jgi:hypothetical protein
MATEVRPAHSPLGASSSERWMNCPGSVALIKALAITIETDEPEYRTKGTSAHSVGYVCLTQNIDAWELAGETHGKHEVDLDIMNAIQMYLDECRRIVAENPGGTEYNEFHIDAPEFHKDFYGTLDRGYVVKNLMFIRDYKHGEGIAIDVEFNPQLMYYAYGLLRHHPEVDTVNLGIVQPRGYHADGPIRTWEVSAESIREWAENTLKPMMDRTALDSDLLPGPHCRFCPAKLVCPVLVSLFGAAMQADPKEIINLSMASIGRSYDMIDGVKFYIKALEAEMMRRLGTGDTSEFAKLVNKKADRVWKDGAKEAFLLKFSEGIYTERKMRSPAQMEELGQEAKSLVKTWAYTPQTGLTVARYDDRRSAIKITKPSEQFAGMAQAVEGGDAAE